MKITKGLLLILVCCGLGLMISACGDDDGVKPSSFRVVINVSDDQGNPVSGLDLSLVPDTPFYQDGKASGYRPSVIIPFILNQPANARLSIEDIEGVEVRLVGERPAVTGVHHWNWDGLDNNEERLPSGVYTAHLVVKHLTTDEVIHEERRDMLMAIMDPARMSVGTTNADGRIILSNQRLFPYLYDPADIPAVDENGHQMGNIRFTPLMRFMLTDLTNAASMRFDRDVDGSTAFNFVWNIDNAARTSNSSGVTSCSRRSSAR